MTEYMPSVEDLSAYVDGELDPEAAAAVARAIARNPQLAKEVACLTRLKATMPKIVPATPIRLRERPRGPAWLYASVPAAAVILVALLGIAAGVFFLNPAPARDWLAVARYQHETWAASEDTGSGANPPLLLAAASEAMGSRVLAPDLSPARLYLTAVEVIQFENRKALHLGYVGTRGCRLSLFVLPVPLKARAADRPNAGDGNPLLIETWARGPQGFILLATGMDPSRFSLLADTLQNYSGFKEPFDSTTRERLVRSRAESPPCTA